jgi:hypothetical protein
MAVIEGGTSGAIQGVGNQAFSGGHVIPGPFPVGSGGGFRLGMQSTTMAAGLAANAEIFQFRYVTAASRVAVIHGVAISAAVLTLPAISTTVIVGPLHLRLTVARAWTAAGSGGTRATLTTNNAKLRTSFATSEVNDAGISTTAALTAGTKTLDTSDIGSTIVSPPGVLTAVGAMSPGQLLPFTDLLGRFDDGHPCTLANQEGLVIRNGAGAFPATMTWTFTVNIAWSEVDAY